MTATWIVGRKAIVAYLRPFLGLAEDVKPAWRALRRWIKKYNFRIRYLPNGIPYLDPIEFQVYWDAYLKRTDTKK